MTSKNDLAMAPDQPRGSEYPARDALDDIDEAAARITDADIEERLRETLSLAGYGHRQHACPSRTTM